MSRCDFDESCLDIAIINNVVPRDVDVSGFPENAPVQPGHSLGSS